jgi:peptidyl-prolyl cis-trans isomerase B (cyclophilin B)
MAHAGRDTGGSQFFFTLSPQPHRDGLYTRFGVVVSGLEILDRIRPGDVIERIEVWTGE